MSINSSCLWEDVENYLLMIAKLYNIKSGSLIVQLDFLPEKIERKYWITMAFAWFNCFRMYGHSSCVRIDYEYIDILAPYLNTFLLMMN